MGASGRLRERAGRLGIRNGILGVGREADDSTGSGELRTYFYNWHEVSRAIAYIYDRQHEGWG